MLAREMLSKAKSNAEGQYLKELPYSMRDRIIRLTQNTLNVHLSFSQRGVIGERREYRVKGKHRNMPGSKLNIWIFNLMKRSGWKQ
jgi:hypothetical protein